MTIDLDGAPSSDRAPSGNSSAGAGPCENAWEGGSEGTINDIESLKQGIIKTSKNKTKAPYTIFLIGETGVGKSSVFELIANVLAGNDIDNYNPDILARPNEHGGSNNHSQTNSARFYELTSRNGIVVRIFDTPGLADTLGVEQEELHKKSIATQIEKHLDSVTAVLVVVNGTVPRLTVGAADRLSSLSAIFPKDNVALLLSNTSNLLFQNFSVDALSGVLKAAPQFLLSNPIALQRKYLELMNDPSMKKERAGFRSAVKAAEQETLEVLVDLFDWLDGL